MNGRKMTIDSKALTRAAASMAKAVKHARLAYQFCPGSYTMTTLQACLTAASALDQHISALAFAHSAEMRGEAQSSIIIKKTGRFLSNLQPTHE